MKNDLVKGFIAILIVAGVTYGVAAFRRDQAAQPATLKPTTPGVAGARQDDTRVVMHINGEPVTEGEFLLFLRQAPEGMQDFFASERGRRIAAGELVKLKTLEQEGRRLGVDRDPAIAAQLEMSRANVIASNALKKLVARPTEAQLRAEYEKQKNTLQTITLSHILVAYQGGQVPPRNGKPLPETAATQKAASIAARARGGADFAALARNESDDVGSAREGGSLGAVAPGAMPPELDQVVQKLAPGQISAPVKSAFGIHIFKAGPRQTQSFESMREALAARVEREQVDQAVKRLQSSAKVEFDPKYFPPQPPAPKQGGG